MVDLRKIAINLSTILCNMTVIMLVKLRSRRRTYTMYLKKAFNKNTGKTYLSIAEGYWDKDKGHTRTKIVEKIGYLEELKNEHEDPVAHYEEVVKEMNRSAGLESAEYTITARKDQALHENTANRKNYGYIVIMKLFYELGLDRFLINRQRRYTKIGCNTSAIMKLLVISRILSPGSKKKAFDEKGRYFDFEKKDAFELIDIYRSLSHFADLSNDIQLLIHDRITKKHGRDMNLVYYDVTNYYFEIDMEDELRKKALC